MRVDDIKIVADEDGFYLEVSRRRRTFPDGEYEDDSFRVLIEEPEDFYNQTVSTIGEWLNEQSAARVSMPAGWGQEPEDSGYAPDDPKHPTYHERMSEISDA